MQEDDQNSGVKNLERKEIDQTSLGVSPMILIGHLGITVRSRHVNLCYKIRSIRAPFAQVLCCGQSGLLVT